MTDTRFESVELPELVQDSEWWKIYEDSFPLQEREPTEAILETVRRRAGLAFRALRGGVTVGIATTHLLLGPAVVFLVYLAVNRGDRCAGAGGRLFEHAWSASAGQLRERGLEPLGLVWEVDPPGGSDRPVGDCIAWRRISFFEKHGGILLDRSYRQPPVNGPDSVPMRLMFRPATGTLPGPAMLETVVRAMYFEKYAAVNHIPAETLDRLLLEAAADRI